MHLVPLASQTCQLSNTCSVGVSCFPSWLSAWLSAKRDLLLHMATDGKHWKSKLEVWFLLNADHFCTIVKLKTSVINHLKSETSTEETEILKFTLSGRNGTYMLDFLAPLPLHFSYSIELWGLLLFQGCAKKNRHSIQSSTQYSLEIRKITQSI